VLYVSSLYLPLKSLNERVEKNERVVMLSYRGSFSSPIFVESLIVVNITDHSSLVVVVELQQ